MFHAPRPNENLAIGRLEYVEVRGFCQPTSCTLCSRNSRVEVLFGVTLEHEALKGTS